MSPERIGRYEIVRELGRGGMAVVYLAHDPHMKRQVAVKVLLHQFSYDDTFRARFQREAEAIAALEHPAIVPLYDHGEDDGQPYLVMRYMPGGTLHSRIRGRPQPLPTIAPILARVAEALDEAHAHKIIHRDLKPGNILFDANDTAYLSDFGLAKVPEASVFSGAGLLGTPAYMSPEQARAAKDLDGRSDVYSLGVILFEMLTGQLPYYADTPMGEAIAHVTEPVPRILAVKPDLPKACEAVIARALAKHRQDRYPTAAELSQAVSDIARRESAARLPAAGGEAVASPPAANPPVASPRRETPQHSTLPPSPGPGDHYRTTPPARAGSPAAIAQPEGRRKAPAWGRVLTGLAAMGVFAGLLAGGGALLMNVVGATPTSTRTPAAATTLAPAWTATITRSPELTPNASATRTSQASQTSTLTATSTRTATATTVPPTQSPPTLTSTAELSVTVTPGCTPPEFFDPFLNRCRLPDPTAGSPPPPPKQPGDGGGGSGGGGGGSPPTPLP